MLIKFNVCTGSTQLARSWVEPVHRLHPVSSELLLRRVLAGRRRRRRNARAPLLAAGPRARGPHADAGLPPVVRALAPVRGRAKAALALLLEDAPRGLSVAFALPPPEYLAGLGCLGLRRFRHRRQRRLRPWLRPWKGVVSVRYRRREWKGVLRGRRRRRRRGRRRRGRRGRRC